MEYIRKALLKWLLGPLADDIVAMKVNYEKIEKHLGSISGLADYVKEKDAQAEELFTTIQQIQVNPEMTFEDINKELQSAASARAAMLESPAIGTNEVLAKNSKLAMIDRFITDLTEKRRHVNPN